MNKKGFTLIELLVVIAIIGVLSSVVLSSLNSARQKARDAQRVSNLTQIRTALEMYYHDNGSYPGSITLGVLNTRSECPGYNGTNPPNDVIPGLIPTYLPSFPADPSMDKANNKSCYIYRTDGIDYALIDHDIQDPGFSYLSNPTFVDTLRDGGSNCSVVDGTNIWAWKVSSPGGACW
ncbi:MAG: type II secretion system protein [Minisyncoccia bacterium]